MTGDELREEARRRAVESAEAQGLPAKVEDPTVLALVAGLIRARPAEGVAA